jgi:hypothetical protein
MPLLSVLLIVIVMMAAGCSPGRWWDHRRGEPIAAESPAAPPPAVAGDEALYPRPVDCSNVPLPPPEEPFPYDYWGHAELPDMTMQEALSTYCTMPPAQWEEFCQDQITAALGISDALEDYVRRWLKGDVSARLPEGLLPPSMDNEKVHGWTLLHPEEVDPREQWYMVPARDNPTDFGQPVLMRAYAETHVTYLRTVFVAPFGSDLLVEGDFPHARFMDFQIQQPFDPYHPVTHNLGQNEVPLVDVDIDPDPGHTNPFRTGADRTGELRHYHVTFDLEMGNASDLNPQAMQAPEFRAPGNRRTGGPMAASGPTGQGVPIPSILWLRYYAPDLGTGPLAGVALPKVLLRLKSGETFWIQADMTEMVRRGACPIPGEESRPVDPPAIIGPDLGWFKVLDCYTMYAEGRGIQQAEPWGKRPIDQVRQEIRATRACFYNRGPEQTPPGNLTPGTTLVPYINYLTRPTTIGRGKVLVFTGRLPTTPQTRGGEPTMEAAELRYWSLCHAGHGPDGRYRGAIYGCVMDDQVALDRNRDYVILVSRPEDRPSNARPECGVTWQARGPEEPQEILIRWLSVYPDHASNPYVPTDELVPWSTGSWSEDTYNPDLVGKNRPGVMGPYHPVLHYMSRQEFEALGCPVEPGQVPSWK